MQQHLGVAQNLCRQTADGSQNSALRCRRSGQAAGQREICVSAPLMGVEKFNRPNCFFEENP